MNKDPVELLQYDLQTLFRKAVRICRAFFKWHAAAGVMMTLLPSATCRRRTRRGLAMNVIVSVISHLLSTRLWIGGDLAMCRRKLRDVGSTVVHTDVGSTVVLIDISSTYTHDFVIVRHCTCYWAGI
jgi:ribosomal protein S14